MRKVSSILWFILLDMLSLSFYKLMGKTEEYEGKNIWYLMIIY